MPGNWRTWARGILGAAISGAATGIAGAATVMGIDPGHFNLDAGAAIGKTLAVFGSAAIVSAILNVAFWLKQSPLPE